jgi:lysophospholipase L1-like esterase
VGIRGPGRLTIALAALGALASTGGAVVGARNLLAIQASQARGMIPKISEAPPRADGVYSPGGGPVQRWTRGVPFDLHLMIFGDSTATGLGCRTADEVPGVLIARGLAEESGKRIRLSTKAISGATSKGLSGQVDAMFVAGPPPDAAVIMVGANDITALNGIAASARRLGAAVRRLRSSDAVVVVGTCPDFGVILAIPQPLRWAARTRGLRLARAQAGAVRGAGGVPVPLADLLAPEFLHAPERLISEDNYHPSAAGYELAARLLLPPLCEALGEWTGPVPEQPTVSSAAEARTLRARLRRLTRLWRRTAGVPAPVVVPTG